MSSLVKLAVLALAAAGVARAQFSQDNPQYFPNSCKTPGQVAIIFTDGPSTFTASLISNLNGATPTKNINLFPVTRFLNDVTVSAPLKNAATAGAFVGMRWTTTVNLTTLTEAQITKQLSDDCALIGTVTGKVPKYIYLSRGDVTQATYTIVKNQGYTPIGYNLDSQDYLLNNTDTDTCLSSIRANYDKVLSAANPASSSFIALERDLLQCTADSITAVIGLIQSYNFTLVDLPTCLGDSNPYRTSCTAGAVAASSSASRASASTSATRSTAAATTAAATTARAAATNTAAAGAPSAGMSLTYSAFNTIAAVAVVAAAFARL